ncbi:MAG TPA: patatin-like phospholipase family protein [Oligoflexus sp.]|uniref:patatin-like phospholipase family protein n=1 Tax=Oligoflexus sp. TaxID=1971216 RepID=UPI002D2B2680|nr:patatin-like phospholipase family protein [Oligoflexus sp.]HYX37231.1 patatin-like phospholipase family protein [Oligoflexus sp.]
MKKILILSFSGGGIRGYLSAKVVEDLQQRVPFLDRVDMFAGTSTGAIIAAFLASGLRKGSEQIVDLYRLEGPRIFKTTLLQNIKSVFGYYSARYNPDCLEKVLKAMFGGMCLGDLKRPILIPAQDLGGTGRPYQAKYFDNFKGNSTDLDIKVVDVLLASAAAPSYFYSHTIEFKPPFGKREFMDGGLPCNHPSVSAVAAACDYNGFDADMKDIYCLHIATGFYPTHALGWKKRGAIGLIRPVIDMATEQYSTVNFQADKILKGGRYCCVGATFREEIEMDDPEAIGKIDRHWPNVAGQMLLAEKYLTEFMKGPANDV